MSASIIVLLVGISGILLLGAITMWATITGAGKPVPRAIKLLALLGGVSLLVSGTGLIAPVNGADGSLNAAPPTAQAGLGLVTAQSGGGELIYSSDFSNDDGRWEMATTAKLGASESRQYSEGRLLVEFRSGAGQYVSHINVNASDLADVEVEGTLARQAGPENMAYGLILRRNRELGEIYFLVNSQNQFGVFSHVAGPGAKFDALVPWTNNGVINADTPNILRAVAKDRLLSVYANGRLLTTVENVPLFSGGTGVLVSLNKPNESGRVSIDDFKVTQLR